MSIYRIYLITMAHVLSSTVGGQNVTAGFAIGGVLHAPASALLIVLAFNAGIIIVTVSFIVMISFYKCRKTNLTKCSIILGPFDSLCRDQILLISIVCWNRDKIGM